MGRYVDKTGKLIGKTFPDEMNLWKKTKKRRWYRKYKRDCLYIVRTDILRKYPFPELNEFKFPADSTLWVELHAKHDCYYTNHVFGTVYHDQNNRITSNIQGWDERYRQYLLSLFLINTIYGIDKTYTTKEKWNNLHVLLFSSYSINKSTKDFLYDIKQPLLRIPIAPWYIIYCLIFKQMKKPVYSKPE